MHVKMQHSIAPWLKDFGKLFHGDEIFFLPLILNVYLVVEGKEEEEEEVENWERKDTSREVLRHEYN